MTNYRRYFLPGGGYFFTVNLAQRNKTLLVHYIDHLRDAFATTKAAHPFNMDAIVILPDHIHAIWTLPQSDSDYPNRWRKIKGRFSRSLPKNEGYRSKSRILKGERGIWQRRYWEHVIRDEVDYKRHMDYVHYKPVKHGHCERVKDWPYSSFHRFVDRGVYTENWGGDANAGCDAGYGES